ncbi:hypothetical protein PUN28_007369 [Cardiocondyla obscurior]|uniref:Uncharacterized protein n=1 Tax=Cardiocondyla obscurior TaxID=286306 RepID=A0AAW2G588_9HYME
MLENAKSGSVRAIELFQQIWSLKGLKITLERDSRSSHKRQIRPSGLAFSSFWLVLVLPSSGGQ